MEANDVGMLHPPGDGQLSLKELWCLYAVEVNRLHSKHLTCGESSPNEDAAESARAERRPLESVPCLNACHSGDH